jgi:hypothetical protein
VSSDPTVGERLAALARSELEELRRQLSQARAGRDRAVHKARKAIQRLRAIVQLLGAIDGDLARRENVNLRRLRRRLAPLRDAAARSETFRVLAARSKWKAWAPLLRELGAMEAQRHVAAWGIHSRDLAFWDRVQGDFEKLTRRASSWPFAALDESLVAKPLHQARRRVRQRVRAAAGETGRELRHELRRKLRRLANLERAVAVAAHGDADRVDHLLSLAKRCGHEGDLWLALSSTRRAARERPTLAPLIEALERARRQLCGRHDALLHEAQLD